MEKCKKCGSCCRRFTLISISHKDVERWQNKNMRDILEKIRAVDDGAIYFEAWFNPKTCREYHIMPVSEKETLQKRISLFYTKNKTKRICNEIRK